MKSWILTYNPAFSFFIHTTSCYTKSSYLFMLFSLCLSLCVWVSVSLSVPLCIYIYTSNCKGHSTTLAGTLGLHERSDFQIMKRVGQMIDSGHDE